MKPSHSLPEVPGVDPEMARVIADFNRDFNEPTSLISPIFADLFIRVGNRILRIFSGQPK